MNDKDNDRKGPAAQGEEGRAQHGYRNEVSWDDGKGRQPYTNQEEELPPAAANRSCSESSTSSPVSTRRRAAPSPP